MKQRDWAEKLALKWLHRQSEKDSGWDAHDLARLLRAERRRAVRACRKLQYVSPGMVFTNVERSYNQAIDDCLAAIQEGR